jgi:hypothetical protein
VLTPGSRSHPSRTEVKVGPGWCRRTKTRTERQRRMTATIAGRRRQNDLLFVVKRQFHGLRGARDRARSAWPAGGSRVGFWVRVVTSPKRRCSGSSRPRRRHGRPGVSCPGLLVTVCGALDVSDEVPPDDVAEPPLQRADCLARCVAVGELAVVVAAADAVRVADLGDRGDVQGVIEPPVAASRQTMGDATTGGELDWGGPGVGRVAGVRWRTGWGRRCSR